MHNNEIGKIDTVRAKRENGISKNRCSHGEVML